MTGSRIPLVIAILLGALLGSAGVAYASFTGSDSATQSISSRSLSGPVSLVATPWGHAVALVWSDGSGGTGYTVFAAANGSSSSCTGADYSAVGTTSFPVWADVRWAPQGTFECYQVATAYDSWTSIDSNPTDVVQLGVVASSVAIVKGGDSSSRVDTGDKIVVTFNQSIADSSQPAAGGSICTSTSGYIALGSSANGATCSTSGLDLGTLTGLHVTSNSRYDASWSWNGADTVLTITVGSRAAGPTPTVTGTGTFAPTTASDALLSDVGGYHVCTSNSGGGNCLPVATGSF
jgi:hypothetical protein